ncbi:hypothetical protein GCM10009603_20010 [Nocardiopsis exhalans]
MHGPVPFPQRTRARFGEGPGRGRPFGTRLRHPCPEQQGEPPDPAKAEPVPVDADRPAFRGDPAGHRVSGRRALRTARKGHGERQSAGPGTRPDQQRHGRAPGKHPQGERPLQP